MRGILTIAGALALCATSAGAGGIERSAQSVAILFEQGNYAEFSFGYATPTVSGTFAGVVPSGDMAPSYTAFSFGYKQALGDSLDIALIYDQPVGADVAYPTGTGYPFQGSTAELRAHAITGVLRYKLPSNVSIIGGLRAQSITGDVMIPLFAGYTLTTDTDYKLGYVVGVAWEKPEIAARVALTYNSSVTHNIDAVEFGVFNSAFDLTIPQSVNLEFQTGIAADTLLFGSIRWVDWSVFDITPPVFGAPLVDYTEDVITYNLGIGRRFNENWSGAVTLGYEDHKGIPVGNLGPTDGSRSVGVGVTYTQGKMKITGGVRYVDIGNATTSTIGARFADNSAWAAGLRVGYSF